MFKPEWPTGPEKCTDIFKNSWNLATPWPDKCRIYNSSSPCNKYELTPDGKAIISC